MPFDHILVAHDGDVATITMNRPERRNALSEALMAELIRAFRDIGVRRRARVVILSGNGPVFSAGHDLRELVGQDLPTCRRLFDVCTELMAVVQQIPQPVIAQVHGIATASGCQLAATCDLVVASEEARFATPGVSIGLFCTTPMVALSRAIGRKRAMEMLLTGTPIDAQTAADWGLVNRVVPADRLESETRDLARQIAAASAMTVSVGKRAFYAQIDLDQQRAYAYAKEVMSQSSMAADAQEGMCAFVEKRKPRWTDR